MLVVITRSARLRERALRCQNPLRIATICFDSKGMHMPPLHRKTFLIDKKLALDIAHFQRYKLLIVCACVCLFVWPAACLLFIGQDWGFVQNIICMLVGLRRKKIEVVCCSKAILTRRLAVKARGKQDQKSDSSPFSFQFTRMSRVGQNHIYTVCTYTVFLAGKSPNIRSHTVYIIRFWPALRMSPLAGSLAFPIFPRTHCVYKRSLCVCCVCVCVFVCV
jgi:hypothetical protein